MICFKDRTFCSTECGNTACDRRWTGELYKQALDWWGEAHPPIAFADYCDTPQCPGWKPCDVEASV